MAKNCGADNDEKSRRHCIFSSRVVFSGDGSIPAFFDERLDCIRIITKDCSVLEERIGDRLTILLNNYDPQPGRKQCVGFTIKGARHLCHQHGWATSTPIRMSQLLDGILASLPDQAVHVFIELVAKPLVEDQKIEQVEMPDCVPEPA